ncbi:MAG: hypothetical protein A3H28_16295 [Acidobacteria bacterium RIFCSPLOWO2_02_FULL_61_28]|nr:MAG: hypothetical protein A3H28_16295 [Acidobacteria bacterium RIFCSPLOWO2_02_FULL_61_28]
MPPEPAVQRKSLLQKPRWVFVAACALCVVAFLGGFFPVQYDYLWDEAVYLSEAENLFDPDPYYEEFSFRPPLFPILLRLGSYLAPLELAAHLLSAASFAGGVLFLYLLGVRLFGSRAGLIAAGLMTTTPFFLHWSHKVMTDIVSTTFAIISLYFLVRHVEEENAGPASACFSGLLLAISTLTRFVLVLAGICAVYFFLVRRLRFRSALWYAGGFLAAVAPYLVWAQVRYGSFLSPFVKAVVIAAGEPVPGRIYYLEPTCVVAGPLTLLGLLCYAGQGSGRQSARWVTTEVPLWLWYLVFLVYLSASLHKEVRYILPAIPPLFLLAGWGFSRISSRVGRMATALAAAILVLFTLRNLPYFDGRLGLGEEFLLNRSAQACRAAHSLQGRLTSGEVIYTSTLYPLAGYCSKRKTVALWPQDQSFYEAFPQNMRQDGYLVFFKDVPKEPPRDWLEARSEFEQVGEYGNILIYKYTLNSPVPPTR